MTNSESESSYFIRIRGRVLGPYTLKQLNTLRVRGQFSQSSEISPDGQKWESAATLELFSSSAKKSIQRTADIADDSQQSSPNVGTSTVPTTPANGSATWHYSVEDEQLGPVPLAELQEMIAVGSLSLNDLVWKGGMPEWIRASEVPELNQILSPRRRSRPKTTAADEDSAPSNHELAPHFLDHVLAGLKQVVDESFISAMGTSSVELGRYAIYVSILLNVALCFIAAVKLNSVNFGLEGVGFAAVALVLQFSAVKSCGALAQVIRATTLRMSSTAFLDSFVVMSLIGGVVVLVTYIVIWIRIQEISVLIVGIGVFLACVQLALTLLHPAAIGITISGRASSGEDAITILSFFMMLPLRFVPAVFALGSTLSILGTITAFYWILSAGSDPFDVIKGGYIAAASGLATLACAAFPFVAYVYFVFAYLIVDVIRSILVVPDKLDQLAIKIMSSRDVQGNDGLHNG